MANFTLVEGRTFHANHFGISSPDDNDGVLPNILQTFPDDLGVIHSDYLVDNALWGSVQTTGVIAPPFAIYGDPLAGNQWQGSGVYERQMTTTLVLYDGLGAPGSGPGGPYPSRDYLGLVTGVTFDYRLHEDYARTGDPASGMWSQEWFHRVSNLSLGLAMFAGDDVVRLHDGDDYFVDIAGRLEISLGGGNDTLFAFDGPDVMGGDIVLGEDGNDTIWYQGNFGRFYGGNGDDTIGDQGGGNIGGHRFYGGTGNDTIEAIGRNSTIYEEEGSGNDHYTGGDDVILDYRLGTAALILDLGLGSAMGGENQTGVYGIDTITGIRRVVGSQGDDQLTGYDHTGTELSGHLGNDVVTGGLFGDTLRGGEGADTLFGGGGADRLDGGAADDEMNGGLGNDIYFVDSLGDVVTGEVAFGAGGGIDTVITSVTFTAPANVELVRAQGLADGITLTGNDAPGTLVGSLGANTLNGRGGNDQLNGNQGNDTLIGGEGRDTLVGGAGADSFVFTSVSNSRTGAASRDYVNGFTRAPGEQDRIDLSAIDANTGLGGIQDFTFIGTAAFTAAGQVRVQSLGGPNACIVEVNVNAGLAADMQIFVNLQQTMAAGDFVL